MAENTNTIYIPYGLEEIDLTALNEALANGYLNYLNSRVWTKGKKGLARAKLWMDAYNKVLLQGITGASIVDGQWKINHNGQEFTYADPKELEIYEDFAGFVLDEMKKLPTRKSKEEEKKEDKKDKYDFRSNFQQDFLNRYYGNNPDLYKSEWFELDPRGEKGVRGTEKRRERLIEALTKYRDESLKDNYDYEGTPFSGYDDVKSRITEAINALQSSNANDDLPALNKLGLDYRSMMYNGANDIYGKDTNGNPVTYLQYYDNLDKITKQEAEIAKKAAEIARTNQYDGYKYFNYLNGTPSNESDFLNIQLKISSGLDLDGNDISRLSWAFRQALKANGLINLSKEELAKMPKYSSNPSRLKKLNGIEGIYYDPYSNKFVKPYKNSQLLQNITLLTILNLNSPEALTKKEHNNKLKAANRKLSEGWEAEDYLRMGAMALDIAGGITAWGGPFGMATSGILGLTSLGTNMLADSFDESLSKWDVAKNTGVNLGLAAVGMVPGLGLASKTGKWLTNIAKWAPRLLTIQALKDTPEVYASIKKAVDTPSKVTNQDWKNIAYGLSIAAGLSRGVKGIVNNRKYKPTITQNTETETFITTKSGNKIKATLKDVDTINKAGRKGGNDKANEELRKLPGAKADDEVNINFKTGVKGKVDLTNKIKLDSSTKNIGQSLEVLRYSRALAIKNIRDKNVHPFLSKYLPTNYDIYLSAARVSVPNINIVDRVKQAWNPVPNRPFKGTNLLNQHSLSNSTTSTSTNSTTPIQTGTKAKPKPSVLSKEDSKELQSTLRGKNFSNNEFKDESRVVGSVKGFGDLYGIRNSDGTHTLQIDFGGTRVNVTGTKADIKGKTLEVLRKDVMKKIDSQIPKENRSRIKFELIKQLKENGYLKQGGTIDKQKIQQYKEFIKK